MDMQRCGSILCQVHMLCAVQDETESHVGAFNINFNINFSAF